MSNKIFVTGPPASGKSRAMADAVQYAIGKGLRVAGFFTPELRRGDAREGFDILSVDGERVPLARKKRVFPGNLKFKTYFINPGAGRFMKNLIEKGLETSDLLVIDEIGPMELFFPEAREAFVKALESEKPVIGVVHRKLGVHDPELYELVKKHIVLDIKHLGREKVMQEIRKLIDSVSKK